MTPNFAKTDQEAEELYKRWKSTDPFPDMEPALLNSADIMDYVALTGMIYPFDPGPPETSKLKPASYEVNLLGKCVYWDADGRKQETNLRAGDVLVLQPNSIAFVTLAPMFRLPDYIALRFNLKITYIYRGLLLGTGPLVDPGFCGRLSIPLHNLTTNQYHLVGGQGIIWMEFTKLSTNLRWQRQGQSKPRCGEYRPFPDRKNQRTNVANYIQEAAGGPVRSSIPEAMESAKKDAESAKNVTAQIRNIGLVAGLALIVGFVAVILALFSYQADVVNLVQEAMFHAEERRKAFSSSQAQIEKQIAAAEESQKSLHKEVIALREELQELREAARSSSPPSDPILP